MREFQGKKRARGWLYSKTVILVLGLIVVFLLNVTWQLYERYRFTKEEKNKAEVTLADLQVRKDFLAGLVASLDTEEGVEQAVRGKFAVVKPGEFVVNIVDRTASTAPTSTIKESWWQGWFD